MDGERSRRENGFTSENDWAPAEVRRFVRRAARMRPMSGHICYHCKQFVEEGEAHDCWTTTEGALLENASEDLREAYDEKAKAQS